MTYIIVPIDFSMTSFNAAHYAARMYKGRVDVTLILYHFYTNSEDTGIAQNYLDGLKKELENQVSNIETALESGSGFTDSLAAFVHVKGALLVIMGLHGKTGMAKLFSGSNTLLMSEKGDCPVLIIPEDAVFRQVSNVLVSSEVKYIDETPCIIALKKILGDFKPRLHILNVDESHYISLTEEVKAARDHMKELLSGFETEFYFMRLYDYHESVEVFAADKNIDMIAIAPRYHSLFEKIFKTQHTKKLVYQSKVPVLVIHE